MSAFETGEMVAEDSVDDDVGTTPTPSPLLLLSIFRLVGLRLVLECNRCADTTLALFFSNLFAHACRFVAKSTLVSNGFSGTTTSSSSSTRVSSLHSLIVSTSSRSSGVSFDIFFVTAIFCCWLYRRVGLVNVLGTAAPPMLFALLFVIVISYVDFLSFVPTSISSFDPIRFLSLNTTRSAALFSEQLDEEFLLL